MCRRDKTNRDVLDLLLARRHNRCAFTGADIIADLAIKPRLVSSKRRTEQPGERLGHRSLIRFGRGDDHVQGDVERANVRDYLDLPE